MTLIRRNGHEKSPRTFPSGVQSFYRSLVIQLNYASSKQCWNGLFFNPFCTLEEFGSLLMLPIKCTVWFACFGLVCSDIERLLRMGWWLKEENPVHGIWVVRCLYISQYVFPMENFRTFRGVAWLSFIFHSVGDVACHVVNPATAI